MKNTKRTTCILATLLIATLASGVAGAGDEPTVAEQVAGLEKMCADTAEARVQRQAAKPLYFRLGEYERIHKLTTEIVRLHNVNEAFTRFMPEVNSERLAKNVADFAAAGTGGPQTYGGREMPAAHAHLQLSDADFLAAGSDVVKGMQNLGYGQDEIDEFVCILVSLKDQVITR